MTQRALQHALTRRALLGTLGAAGATILAGCTSSPRPPSRPAEDRVTRPDKEPAIFDLSFEEQSRYRPFHVIAPGFVALTEPSAGRPDRLVTSDTAPPAPFAAVEASVSRLDRGLVLAGLASDEDEHVLATYDRSRGRVAIEVRQAGRTRLVRRKKIDLPATFRFGFVLCENKVTVIVDAGSGWQPVLTERERVASAVDLRAPETLSRFRYAWGLRDADESAELGAVRAGLFGMTGLRDLHLVQHSDGRPYVRDGRVYLTATCAGMGFFQQAHWGVFTLDLDDPTRLEQTAQLFSLRDGLLLGDHAGQVVRDDENDEWIVATSSWGDFAFAGVHVRHSVTRDDVLSGVHLLETERTPLPTSVSSWDPGMTRIDGTWHVGFVESPSQDPFDFHPALAAAVPGGAWTDGLQLVGAAKDLHQCEGPIIAQVEQRWWFLASDGEARHYPVYDMEMRRTGRLDAPYPTNIPHPQLLRLDDGSHLMITFEGTQYAEKVLGYGGHGDVVIMRSRT